MLPFCKTSGARPLFVIQMLHLLVILFVCLAHGAGEISILQTPDSLTFSGQEQMDLSNVKNVLSAAMGFTTPEVSYF